jgi:hypothetical protein
VKPGCFGQTLVVSLLYYLSAKGRYHQSSGRLLWRPPLHHTLACACLPHPASKASLFEQFAKSK